MLSNVLFGKVDLTVALEFTIDFKLTYFVRTASIDAIVPDIHVAEYHLSFIAVLHVDTSPSLVATSHFEGVRETLDTPATRDSLTVYEISFVQDSVLAKILLLEMSFAVWLDISLKNEISNVIRPLTSKYLTRSSLELHPIHVMVLTILLIGALPH
jgi:hypothetical protein